MAYSCDMITLDKLFQVLLMSQVLKVKQVGHTGLLRKHAYQLCKEPGVPGSDKKKTWRVSFERGCVPAVQRNVQRKRTFGECLLRKDAYQLCKGREGIGWALKLKWKVLVVDNILGNILVLAVDNILDNILLWTISCSSCAVTGSILWASIPKKCWIHREYSNQPPIQFCLYFHLFSHGYKTE